MIWKCFIALLKERRGATAIEYALIAAGIAIVIIVAVNSVGNQLSNFFNNLATNI